VRRDIRLALDALESETDALCEGLRARRRAKLRLTHSRLLLAPMPYIVPTEARQALPIAPPELSWAEAAETVDTGAALRAGRLLVLASLGIAIVLFLSADQLSWVGAVERTPITASKEVGRCSGVCAQRALGGQRPRFEMSGSRPVQTNPELGRKPALRKQRAWRCLTAECGSDGASY